MRKIIEGVRQFQTTTFCQQKELFETLSRKKQSPQALFITCSDSRINPNLLTSTEPGDLFLLRNAGNIIPPYGAASGGEGATVEYAVAVLGVSHIIVCGHYGCGAMHALLHLEQTEELPAVRTWFAHAEATRRIIKEKYLHLPAEAREEAAIEQNVLLQMVNLRTHPSVAAALERGVLSLHGWVYRIATGEVMVFDPVARRYRPLGEVESTPAPPVPDWSCAPVA